ncbi:helix-turn-helix domain-containing protein [Sphingomonas adhaesiva]|uniref:helix-turn-helix domain-containing protein n=1 Tax=Sphingomonas adhaesiva TaxID=28212 RepID=UPI002FFBCB61
METRPVPSFYLYGEPHRAVAPDFVHAELLDDRSRPSDWTILPHAHADLAQIFLLETGGGTMRAEAETFAIHAPSLLIVPPGVVHGFDWQRESTGAVLTASIRHLNDLCASYPDLATVFDRATVQRIDATRAALVRAAIGDLMRELGWSAPGHRAAVDAALLAILVGALRTVSGASSGVVAAPGHHSALVARFRARVEERFRLREPIVAYAAALGSSESRLRVACAQVAAQSPAAMLDQRALLEAQRALLYTNLSIAEVGYSLGFADPAYFSRFFTRHAGISPRGYRSAATWETNARRAGTGNPPPVPGIDAA